MKDEIRKKILTTTIGALARFEKYFGHLWGHNQENINADQEQLLDLWEETRYEILNLGNKQIRSLDDLFNKSQFRYTYHFKVKQPGDNNG